MSQSKYIFRHALEADDPKKLKELYGSAFHDEDVAGFADTLLHHFPGLDRRYWYVAEDEKSGKIVSALCLIPWTWMMNGIPLRVAEMGIVATDAGHRKQGLIRRLGEMFAGTVADESFDLCGIQGIPGFYHRLGYHYAVPLNNNVRVPFHTVGHGFDWGFSFRRASIDDIPFLIKEDQTGAEKNFLFVQRSAEHWRYLLSHSLDTECAGHFWIMERPASGERYYFRISLYGFGKGLIVSEASETVTSDAVRSMLSFCRDRAVEQGKPYIRLNMGTESAAVRIAQRLGTESEPAYAWQIKIPDTVRLIEKMAPVLEQRLADGPFRGYTGAFVFDTYKSAVNIRFEKGLVASVTEQNGAGAHTLSLTEDCVPPVLLGYRTWREFQYLRPDVAPSSKEGGLFADCLFPRESAWIHCQY